MKLFFKMVFVIGYPPAYPAYPPYQNQVVPVGVVPPPEKNFYPAMPSAPPPMMYPQGPQTATTYMVNSQPWPSNSTVIVEERRGHHHHDTVIIDGRPKETIIVEERRHHHHHHPNTVIIEERPRETIIIEEVIKQLDDHCSFFPPVLQRT